MKSLMKDSNYEGLCILVSINSTRNCLVESSAFILKNIKLTFQGKNKKFPVVSLDFSVTYSFRPFHGPGVDSAPSENEYQEHFLGVKAAGA